MTVGGHGHTTIERDRVVEDRSSMGIIVGVIVAAIVAVALYFAFANNGSGVDDRGGNTTNIENVAPGGDGGTSGGGTTTDGGSNPTTP